ncbi:MAG: glycosyltransferase family 2 protein [Desulfatiglandales bacterium]|jgi:glycosyltransferase involved in cell wall biosynthesis|nr:glycosyltransferase family 2 protein [Desulfatiglandales bacterium]|tara:strand:- start:349 stop:1338 length:990 start_codon:yes stop_codon:yes gene_type:complete
MKDPISDTLSVVIPLHNESELLDALFARLLPTLDGIGISYEVICVNDGSDDDTLEQILAIRAGNAHVKALDLTRRFGKEVALTAGIEHALGDVVVVMDGDLQDPPELIPPMVKKWQEGFQVVYATRQTRDGDSLLKKMTAKAFYTLFNRLSDTSIPPDAGDFRLMDRDVIEALNRLPERSRFMKGLFSWVGFRQTGIPFERPSRHAGRSKWSYLKLFRFALDGLFSFSTLPLRIWIWVGSVIASTSFLYAVYLMLRTLFQGVDQPGYASLMVTVLFLGGIQLISIGVVGEYIGRIFDETKRRPLYLIHQAYGVRVVNSQDQKNHLQASN